MNTRFGGLVPISRDQEEVLTQLSGPNKYGPARVIDRDSPLGLAKRAGAKTHLFGLNSPDWYRWIKRFGVDSFDGSKLSTEGAVNGILWLKGDEDIRGLPNANGVFRRLMVKKIAQRDVIRGDNHNSFEFSEDGQIMDSNPGWEYLIPQVPQSKVPHGPEAHFCDPRVTGHEHKGRTVYNS